MTPKTLLGKTYYTAAEIASLLDLTTITVRNYIKNGRLDGVKIGTRIFITEESLKRLLDPNKQG